MSTTIEQLEIDVQSKSQSAVSGIDALASSLEKLKIATKGGAGLTSVSKQLTTLNTALNGLSGTNASNLNKLAQGLQTLSNCGKLKLSSSVANQITNIGSAVRSLNGTNFSFMTSLTSALSPMSGMGKANLNSFISQLQRLPQAVQALDSVNIGNFGTQISQLTSALTPLSNMGKNNLTSFVTQLRQIPQVMTSLKSVNMGELTTQIKQLADAFAPLGTQMKHISNGFASFPVRIQRLITSTEKLTDSNNKASKSYVNLAAKITVVITAMRTASRVLASWITESNKYIENLNLFNASMGTYAAEAQKYAEQVGEIMGIDPGQWMRNQGVFMTLATGFGVASDRAYIMSQNLTQLGYDLSSFFNISFEDSMQKLQSGISGELEPLRRLGYDLSVARLQQEALSLGIEKSVNAMTQAEKAELRYYAIMTQVTTAQGDMARTLHAPANQLRILQAQVTMCARSLGNIFIPILNAVLPYAIAFAKVIRMIADAIASLFGFKLPEVDYSGIGAAVGDVSDGVDNVGSGLGNAAKKAKELKNHLLGIDELNVISQDDPTGSSGSGGGGVGAGGGGGLGFDLPTYDFLADAINGKVDEIVNFLKGALSEITAVISGFLLAIGTILVVTGANIPLGLGLMAVGAIGLVSTIVANWNSMSERLAKTLTIVTSVIGGFLLAIGALLAFTGGNIPLGIALMAAGAVSLVSAVVINWKKLNGDLTNALSILTGAVGGALLGVGAILAFSGINIPLGIALMAAGAVGVVSAVSLNWDILPNSVKDVITILEAAVGGGLLALGALLAFSGIGVGLGIALMAAGAVALVSAVVVNWDSITSDVQGVVNVIQGIVGGGLLAVGALLAFTGVNVPLGVAFIAAGAATLISAVALNWGGMSEKIKGTISKITTIVSAGMLAIGALLTFSGIAPMLGISLIAAGAVGMVATVAANWDSIVTKVKEVLKKIGVIAGAATLALGVLLVLTGVGLPLGLGLIAVGAATLASGIALNWDTIKNKVKEVIEKIGEVVKKYGGLALGVILMLTGAGIPLGIGLILKHLKGSASEGSIDWDSIKGKVQTGLDGVAEKFGDFKETVGEKLNGAKETIQEWGANTKEWFTKGKDGKGVVEHFKETAGNIVEGFKEKVGSSYPTTKTNITTWASKAKEWFSSSSFGGVNGTSFGTFAMNIINGFKDKIGSNYVDSKSNTTTWAAKVKEWFTSSSFGGVNSTNFATFAMNTITGFKNKMGEKYTDSKSNTTTWAAKVREWFTSSGYGNVNGTKFGEFAINIITGFKDKIGSKYTDSKSNTTTWASSVRSWFTGSNFGNVNSSKFGEFALNAITGFKDKIGAKYTNAKVNMTTWASSVKTWFTNKVSYSKFYDVASDVIKGFKDGIGKLYKTCKDTITSWGASIISWFKDKLDSNSPSKVFDTIGCDTVLGYNNAIQRVGKSTKGIVSKWADSFTSVTPNMKLSVDTSALKYYDSETFSKSVSANVTSNSSITAVGFKEGMEEFYKEYLQPTMKQMADDVRRQADKNEQTIVNVGNRTITDAVTTQQKANGYNFVTV